MSITSETKVQLYQTMLRCRRMEEKLLELYRAGQVPGTIHLSSGQEAVATGLISALRGDDKLLATYRGHTHALVKGLSQREIVAEVLGRSTGCCGGLGGSMHLSDPGKGLLLTTTLIASNIPISAGVGYTLNHLKSEGIVMTFVGDGATNNGNFHEGLNLASIWKAPLLLVIENNKYAISVGINKSANVEKLSARSASYGIPGYTVDGMNVFEVHKFARELVERVRTERHPILLEALTYRFGGHYAGDVLQPYRTKEEVEEWRKRDPIVIARDVLLAEGLLSEDAARGLEEAATKEAEDAATFALSSPFPEAVGPVGKS